MTKSGEKATEPKNLGNAVGKGAELRNGSGSANQRAEPGTMENGGPVEETHVGDGTFAARMVVYVAGVGVSNENIGAGMAPTAPKTKTRCAGKILNDRLCTLPRCTAPLRQMTSKVMCGASDVGAGL